MTGLERRYRRLLACYPRRYREAYGEEMLGVLLEGAGPDRRRPTLGETVDLLAGALRYRLRANQGGPAWQDAGAVAALAAPLLLLAMHLAALLDTMPVPRRYFGDSPPVGPSVWVPPLVWGLVVLAALAGLRQTAAALGWLGLVVEAGTIGLLVHRFGPLYLPLWTVPFAVAAALGLTLTPGARRGLRLLGPVGSVALAATTVLVGAGEWLSGLASLPILLGTMPMQWLLSPRVLAVPLALFLLLRLPRPLRRRALLLIVPVLAYTVGTSVVSTYVGDDSYLTGRWAYVETLAPLAFAVATFLLGRALLRWWERRADGLGAQARP